MRMVGAYVLGGTIRVMRVALNAFRKHFVDFYNSCMLDRVYAVVWTLGPAECNCFRV